MRLTSIISYIGLAALGADSAAADSLPPPPTTVYMAPSMPSCETRTIQIYFPVGEALLTHQASQALAALRADIDQCDLNHVDVTSITADGRDAAELESLARARLDVVTATFDHSGVSNARIRSALNTQFMDAGLTKPMRRRVTVHLDLEQHQAG